MYEQKDTEDSNKNKTIIIHQHYCEIEYLLFNG